MEIVIDEWGTHSIFSTEEQGSNIIPYAPWIRYYIPWEVRKIGTVPISGRRTGIRTISHMEITPLRGKEEEVERFVAIGRLQNKNFPFCIANSKDYSKIDSE